MAGWQVGWRVSAQQQSSVENRGWRHSGSSQELRNTRWCQLLSETSEVAPPWQPAGKHWTRKQRGRGVTLCPEMLTVIHCMYVTPLGGDTNITSGEGGEGGGNPYCLFRFLNLLLSRNVISCKNPNANSQKTYPNSAQIYINLMPLLGEVTFMKTTTAIWLLPRFWIWLILRSHLLRSHSATANKLCVPGLSSVKPATTYFFPLLMLMSGTFPPRLNWFLCS